MLRKIIDGVEHIYFAVGATDFRKQIPGLAALVQGRFQLEPYSLVCLLLFCNKRRTCLKTLRYDSNGFLLASKSLLGEQKFLWPKSEESVRDSTQIQFEWLLQDIAIDQKHACGMLLEEQYGIGF